MEVTVALDERRADDAGGRQRRGHGRRHLRTGHAARLLHEDRHRTRAARPRVWRWSRRWCGATTERCTADVTYGSVVTVTVRPVGDLRADRRGRSPHRRSAPHVSRHGWKAFRPSPWFTPPGTRCDARRRPPPPARRSTWCCSTSGLPDASGISLASALAGSAPCAGHHRDHVRARPRDGARRRRPRSAGVSAEAVHVRRVSRPAGALPAIPLGTSRRCRRRQPGGGGPGHGRVADHHRQVGRSEGRGPADQRRHRAGGARQRQTD